MTVAQQAVAEARLWLGTPYVHQASCRGAGTDCLGRLRGVWRALYGAEPEAVPAYTPDWAEPVGDEVLLRAGRRLLLAKPVGDEAAGDVIRHYFDASGHLIDWEGEARMIAVSPDQLRRARLVIGVAAGPAKAQAILGAARSGLVNALVTDSATAQALLDLSA